MNFVLFPSVFSLFVRSFFVHFPIFRHMQEPPQIFEIRESGEHLRKLETWARKRKIHPQPNDVAGFFYECYNRKAKGEMEEVKNRNEPHVWWVRHCTVLLYLGCPDPIKPPTPTPTLPSPPIPICIAVLHGVDASHGWLLVSPFLNLFPSSSRNKLKRRKPNPAHQKTLQQPRVIQMHRIPCQFVLGYSVQETPLI